MGLVGIHHPNALQHFNGVTHCPWCSIECQNEGTIINHLRTVHYKLGLVCKKCFHCPSIMSEAIQHHGQKNCQPSVEGGPIKSSSSLNTGRFIFIWAPSSLFHLPHWEHWDPSDLSDMDDINEAINNELLSLSNLWSREGDGN